MSVWTQKTSSGGAPRATSASAGAGARASAGGWRGEGEGATARAPRATRAERGVQDRRGGGDQEAKLTACAGRERGGWRTMARAREVRAAWEARRAQHAAQGPGWGTARAVFAALAAVLAAAAATAAAWRVGTARAAREFLGPAVALSADALRDAVPRRVLDLVTGENDRWRCEAPALPPGEFTVVVAAHKFVADTSAISELSHLADLGLTNAHFEWYRRDPKAARMPARQWTMACNMAASERVLPVDRGQEAAAFWDFAARRGGDPPLVVAFVHGHGGIAFHTSCRALFSRSAYYYREVAQAHRAPGAHRAAVLDSMLTLTDSPEGHASDPFSWHGDRARGGHGTTNETEAGARMQALIESPSNVLKQDLPRLGQEKDWEDDMELDRADASSPKHQQAGEAALRASTKRCDDILNAHGVMRRTPPPLGSCCASFVMPGERLRRYPVRMYEALLNFTLAEDGDDAAAARACFELMVWHLFGDEDTALGVPPPPRLVSAYAFAERGAVSEPAAMRAGRCARAEHEFTEGGSLNEQSPDFSDSAIARWKPRAVVAANRSDAGATRRRGQR